jgi:hypothetical protein
VVEASSVKRQGPEGCLDGAEFPGNNAMVLSNKKSKEVSCLDESALREADRFVSLLTKRRAQ